MLLREYKSDDADIILTWIDDERELRLWSADRYGDYPVTSEDVNNNYNECKSVSNFYPLTLEDDGKIIGHLILRIPGDDKCVIRLGFIIVDNNKGNILITNLNGLLRYMPSKKVWVKSIINISKGELLWN